MDDVDVLAESNLSKLTSRTFAEFCKISRGACSEISIFSFEKSAFASAASFVAASALSAERHSLFQNLDFTL